MHKILDGGEISVLIKPSKNKCGDLAGYFDIPEARLAIYSADVSGKGASSAVMASRLSGTFCDVNKSRALVFKRGIDGGFIPRAPRQIAAVLNREILRTMETDLYFTMAYADINLRNGKTKLVQAGHPYPIVFNARWGAKIIGSGGMPIGLIENAEFEDSTVGLQHGDKLLFYTDGIVECENRHGIEYSDQRLMEFLASNAQLNTAEILDKLLTELTRFCSRSDFDDDISAVLFEYRQPKTTPRTAAHDIIPKSLR